MKYRQACSVLLITSAYWKAKSAYTSNEPVMLCLMSAIETGVIFLINDGIDRGLWDLQNKADRQNDILVKYRELSVPPES
ncbi:assembly/transport component in curli production [Salmonella enterica subsp. enterica]|uniref:Curli production assembly/transport component CsgG n=1 Tax=Salmonella enterica I TaxID=59201 RepID=A0A379WXT2_SALET|nr:assembly/transport component in curli production [Salmonella enterica subsp. enterica]